MLILLGGFLGSGRKLLSRNLAKRYGFHYCDLDQKKLSDNFMDRKGIFHEHVKQPKTDADRIRLYDLVVRDFPLLSKMYTDVVIDDAFHREVPREHFFKIAKKYFDPVIFVWIDSDEPEARKRLVRMHENGMIKSLGEGLQRRKRAQAHFQPFSEPMPTFRIPVSGRGAVKSLYALIQGEIKHISWSASVLSHKKVAKSGS